MSRAEFNPGAGSPEARQSVDARRKQKSLQIINGILTDGLLSADDQIRKGQDPFMSNDIRQRNFSTERTPVWGRLIVPLNTSSEKIDLDTMGGRNPRGKIKIGENLYIDEIIPSKYRNKVPEYLLIDALYGGFMGKEPWSVYPVIAERQGEFYNRKFAEERLSNSLLVVSSLGKYESETPNNGQINGRMKLFSPVLPSKIDAILLPEQLERELGLDIETKDIQIRKVKNRKGRIWGKKLSLPDYESALREMLEETGEPLFLHGVRLPTNEDVEMGRV